MLRPSRIDRMLLERLEPRVLLSVVLNPTDDQDVFVDVPLELDFTFSDDDLDSSHTAMIDWGDGTIEPLVVDEGESGSGGSLDITIRYDYDNNNFFDTQEKKDLLELAADTITNRFGDDLQSIIADGSNTWSAVFSNPATGGQSQIPNLDVAANQIIVFAGGRDLGGPLGIGGPGGFSASGTSTWLNRVSARGEAGALKASGKESDFGPWGGSISFDTSVETDWYFGLDADGMGFNQADFLSVALHELSHLFGLGTAESWDAQIKNGTFEGPASIAEYNGEGNPPVTDGHWASGTTDEVNGIEQEAAMDPELLLGTRKLMTNLDFAGLDDIGWDLLAPLQISGSMAAAHTYDESGDFTVVVTVEDDLGAQASDTIIVHAEYDTSATIGDLVFEDRNGNGKLGKNETGIANITLDLYVDENGDGLFDGGDTFFQTQTTDADGFYNFTDLIEGKYIVQITDTNNLLDGFFLTTPADTEFAVDLARGEDFNDADFGWVDPGSLQFGNVDGSANVKLEFQGVTYLLRGAGTGTLLFDGSDISVEFAGTDDRSNAKFTVPRGQTFDVIDVDILDGPMKQVDMRAGDLMGDFTAVAGVGKFRARNIDAQHTVTIGPDENPKASFTLQANQVFDTTIISQIPLKKIQVDDWQDTDVDPDSITAPWANQIKSKGDFQADLTLTDANQKATLNKLQAAGEISSAVIRVAGNINNIIAGAFNDVQIFAGMDAISTLPDSIDDFVNPLAVIKKVQSKGLADLDTDFTDTIISGFTVKTAILRRVAFVNGAEPFGLAADFINTLKYIQDGSTTTLKKLTVPGADDVSIDDFLVRLFDQA